MTTLYIIPGRQAFRDWLSKRLSRNVGRPGRTASCPLATWLRQVNQNRRLHVCLTARSLVLADPKEPNGLFDLMPEWCEDFAEAFDTLVERGPTTGDVALSVLDDLQQHA
jgi:hypothetical protein